jgi:hypothetical protein
VRRGAPKFGAKKNRVTSLSMTVQWVDYVDENKREA